MRIIAKTFTELKLKDLYNLLQLRSEVFVVEQNCVYQDIDGKDMKALHLLGYNDDTLIAYTRCFAPADYFEEASIGRVIVKKNYRNSGYGHEILQASLKEIENRYNTTNIKLSAQQYLTEFYESHGFYQTGYGYLEDGIPHIAMIKP